MEIDLQSEVNILKTKTLNYFELANTQLSLELAQTTKAQSDHNKANQIASAFHEATHFIIEMVHKRTPLRLSVSTSAKGNNLGYGPNVLGECATFDNGLLGDIESHLGAFFYEMISGHGEYFQYEIDDAKGYHESAITWYANTKPPTLIEMLVDVGDKVIDLWPLIYICMVAILKYRKRTPIGEVPEWVQFSLKDFVSTMLKNSTVKAYDGKNTINLDFDYFFHSTPKLFECIVWLQAYIPSKQKVEDCDLVNELIGEIKLHNNRFSSFSNLN